jgi:hypothetical protein
LFHSLVFYNIKSSYMWVLYRFCKLFYPVLAGLISAYEQGRMTDLKPIWLFLIHVFACWQWRKIAPKSVWLTLIWDMLLLPYKQMADSFVSNLIYKKKCIFSFSFHLCTSEHSIKQLAKSIQNPHIWRLNYIVEY